MKIDIGTTKISDRERFLEAIVQSAIDYAIISMDLDGLVTSWNEGAQNILGWTAEEMVGRPGTAFFTEQDRQDGVPQSEMTSALHIGRGSDERWHLKADGTTFWASGEMMALKTDDGNVIGFIKILRDRTEQREQADRQRLLMHELGHRLKNTLAVVQSIVTQSMRNAASVDDASEKLQSRISAYAKAHEILLRSEWFGATLANIVDAAKATVAMSDNDRIRVSGSEVNLGPQAALSFSLVLHELFTNAFKYGSLSNVTGRVEIVWRIEQRDNGAFLVSSWTEIGGPIVKKPERKGFGSRLIEASLRAYGEVIVSFEPEGLTVRTDMELAKLQYRSEFDGGVA